jgi:hypothetical protein
MEGNPGKFHQERNFILQQGLVAPPEGICPARYSALMFQPRLVGTVVLLAVILQSPLIFLALSGVLYWNVFFPRWNPFDALYNRTLGDRPGAVLLTPAPPPRRFAQGMAGSFMLAIALSLLFRWNSAAFLLEALLLAALTALVFGKFCLGSFLFHLFRGDADFARRTLPWGRGI